MTIKVIYCSRSGNTKLLAESAAAAVETNAETTDTQLEEKADIVLLGSSVYAGSPDKSVYEFLEKNADKIGTLAVFGSSASGSSAFRKIKPFAEKLGIRVFEKFYNCPGHFLFMHKEHPDQNDLYGVSAFAKMVRYRA